MTSTESTWRGRVARWRSSGQTAHDFAAQEGGFEASTLRYWASRLRRIDRGAEPTAALRLLPVHVRAARDLEVRVGDVIVTVPEGVDVERAASLVRALREEAR
jgi:hypothetical protein